MLAVCAVALALTNCGDGSGPTAGSIIEKALKFGKIGQDAASLKAINDFYTDEQKAKIEKLIEGACNADDRKIMDAVLDCKIVARESFAKSNKDKAAEKVAGKAFAKCQEGKKLDEKCDQVIAPFLKAFSADK